MQVKNYNGYYIAQMRRHKEYFIGNGKSFIEAIRDCLLDIQAFLDKDKPQIIGTYKPTVKSNAKEETDEEGDEE